MKGIRRGLAVMLSLCMVFSMNVTAFAEETDVGNSESNAIAQVGGKNYDTLAAAVDAASKGDTITVLKSAETSGVVVNADKDVTIDLAGNTLSIASPTVGSTGTETNGFQLLKGSKVTFKNGTIVPTSDSAKIFIQNYSDLTLEDVTLDASKSTITQYALSNNFGHVTIKGDTNIYAADGQRAFDVWYGLDKDGAYDDGVSVTFDDSFTGTVKGKIEYGAETRAASKDWVSKTKLSIGGKGTFNTTFVDSNANDNVALKDSNIVITGGTFSEDPSNFVKEPYSVSRTSDTSFTVVAQVEPAQGKNEVADVPEDSTMNETEKEEVKQIAQNVEVPVTQEVTNVVEELKKNETVITDAQEELKKSDIKFDDTKPVVVYVQTYTEVKPIEYKEETGEVSLEITPMYKVVASQEVDTTNLKTDGDSKNAVQVGEATKLEVKEKVEVSVVLPKKTFASKTVYVKHETKDGNEYSEAKADEDGKLTFTTTGFSPFTFTTEKTKVSKIEINAPEAGKDLATSVTGDGYKASVTWSLKGDKAVCETEYKATATLELSAGFELAATLDDGWKLVDADKNVIEKSFTKTTDHKWGSWKVVKAATYDAAGVQERTCSVCGKKETRDIAKLSRISISKAYVSGIKDKTYNGKNQYQGITVKVGSKTLKYGTDYTVSYRNNKNVGLATLTITGKGGYTGSVTKTFKINPKSTSLTKLSKYSKAFKAYWKKQSSQVTGYQVRYSLKSSMGGSKTVTVTSYKTTSKKISRLKKKKKYYVQIRTYKTVGKTKYYSSWSSKKNVKTK